MQRVVLQHFERVLAACGDNFLLFEHLWWSVKSHWSIFLNVVKVLEDGRLYSKTSDLLMAPIIANQWFSNWPRQRFGEKKRISVKMENGSTWPIIGAQIFINNYYCKNWRFHFFFLIFRIVQISFGNNGDLFEKNNNFFSCWKNKINENGLLK